MTEREFIRQNSQKWQALEAQLDATNRDPDVLVDLFTKVSGDLSYARTYYPNRSVRLYLNGLTQRVFDTLGKRKRRLSVSTITDFYRHTLPQEIIRSRHALWTSLAVFSLAVAIGALSTAHDPDFPVLIMGKEYMDMTMNNINNDDPMAVYKDEGMVDMFLGITINNVRVAMLAFVFGLTAGLGSIILLIRNGIMLGTFQYFFFQKGLFMTSFLTIWIHGTIEIASIVIAGGAGLVLGNAILFPKTYSRMASLQIGAYRALRILLGTEPLFIAAGLLESFVTRHTEWPAAIKGGIILVSAILIIFMWIIYPWLYSKTGYIATPLRLDSSAGSASELDPAGVTQLSSILTKAMSNIRSHLGWLMKYAVLPGWGIVLVGSWLYYRRVLTDDTIAQYLMHESTGDWHMYVAYTIAMSYTTMMAIVRLRRFHDTRDRTLGFIKYNGLRVLIAIGIMWAMIYFMPDWWWLLVVAIIPLHVFISWATDINQYSGSSFDKLSYYLSTTYRSWGYYMIVMLVLLLLSSSILGLLNTGLSMSLTDFLTWHDFGLQDGYSYYWFYNGITSLLPLLLIPLGVYISAYLHIAVDNKYEASDLKERLKAFGEGIEKAMNP